MLSGHFLDNDKEDYNKKTRDDLQRIKGITDEKFPKTDNDYQWNGKKLYYSNETLTLTHETLSLVPKVE